MVVGGFLVTPMMRVLPQSDNRRRSARCWQAVAMIALVTLFSPNAQADFTFPFSEDWESGSIDPTRWNSWGFPLPALQSENAVGDHSLDPNGDSSYHSGVVSADTFALSGGVRVSIDAYIESASQWSELTFGLADTTAISTNPNLNLSALAEVTIDADTQGSVGYKFFTRFASDGVVEIDYPLAASGLTPESVFDAWHTYVFEFAANGSAQVLVDDVLAFETAAGFFDYSSEGEFSVLLGGRSYGATVNLYDSISAVQVPEPGTLMTLSFGGLLLLLFRRRLPRGGRT